MREDINFVSYTHENSFIDKSVKIGKRVTIYPGNILVNGTQIGDDVTLLPNNYISGSTIGAASKIFSSVIEDSVVCENATIGPFSHLRPNSKISSGARIGNFVEIKNSTIGEKTKVSHLSYVGDAEVGRNTNIGCGVVFINYNGKIKQKTRVGEGCFVGSSVNLIAPLEIGDKSFICAGTTVDGNVKSGDFVIGRSRMQIKSERAKNYLK